MKDTLAHLQTRGDLFTRQLLSEKDRVSRLQNELSHVNDEISQIRDSNKQKAVQLLNMHTTTARDAYRRADGLDPTRLADINQKKLVKNLESRLNKALVRHNEVQNQNNAIKAQIDKFRRKIKNDNVNRSTMEKKLVTLQDEMDRIMEKAALASEGRDRAVERRLLLLDANADEERAFQKEYREMGEYVAERTELLEASIAAVSDSVMSQSQLVKEGSGTAGRDHMPVSSTAATPAVNSGVGATAGSSGSCKTAKKGAFLERDDVTILGEKISEADEALSETRKFLRQTEDKIHTYEENFRQLRDVSGLESNDDITTAFVKNEDESFSLFNYIQTVSQETDVTLEQCAQLERDIEDYSTYHRERESQKASTVRDYEERLREAKEERRKMNDMAREGKETIEKIAEKVQTLYGTVQCDELEGVGTGAAEGTMAVSSKTGELQLVNAATGGEGVSVAGMFPSGHNITTASTAGEHVSERNILRSMELIEKRSIQIIAAYARMLAFNKKNRRKPSVLLSPKMFRKLSCASRRASDTHHNLQFSDDDDDDDDDDEDVSDDDNYNNRPLSLHEMRRQTAERLKRSQTATVGGALGLDIRKQLKKAAS